jgi:glycolate oxidase
VLSSVDQLLDELARDVDDVVADPAVIEGYRRDEAAPGLLEAGMPAAVVRPRDTAQVASAVRVASSHGVPIVPRGAGSGLSGGANAIDGCVVVCLERMADVIDVDAPSLTATVEPGVINAALKRVAASAGLWYAPDPASFEFCTVGGNVATNAGGLCCVKHGVTRDAVLGVEVVLADGQVLHLGRRTRKGVMGYDLTALMCGSEGTLAIVTAVTTRLLPPEQVAGTIVATFSDLGAAGRAVARIVGGVTPSLLEIMDAPTIAAVQAFKPMSFEDPPAALLFARAERAEDVARIAQWCEDARADLVVTSDEQAEGRMLLAARRLAYPALERMGATLLDDVAVPVARIPDLLDAVPGVAAAHEVTIGTFGHAGDGNLHPTIVYDRDDPDAPGRARAAFEAIVRLALALGGTATGEHGVGALKTTFCDAELGAARGLHRAVKRAFDPAGLMNPGKAI